MPIRNYPSSQSEIFGHKAADRLPIGHICFHIDEIVEVLALGPSARGNAARGAPIYDPRMLLKILIFAYFRGIRSSRRIAAECRENLAFIHLCRGTAPSFRTICRFRSENEALLHSVFSELIRRLILAGVVRADHVIVDGSKIRASASNAKTLNSKFFDEVKASIEAWMSSSALLDEEEELREKLSSMGIESSKNFLGIDSLQRLVDRCSQAVEEGEANGSTKVSLTDPESRFMRDGATGKIGLSYNVQVAVDKERGIPLACDVTQDAVDNNSLCRVVDEVEMNTCETVEAVDGDSGYFNSEQLRRLENEGKDACVADSDTVSAMRKSKLSEFIQGERFRYDSERDIFRCPLGNELVFTRLCHRKDGRIHRIYEAVNPCDECPQREICLGGSRNRFYKMERNYEYPWLDEYRRRFLKSEYQERLKSRKRIEHIFGHLKHNLGLRRFNLRGLSGAKIEAFLASIALVLRRIHTILTQTRCTWAELLAA
ncbi:MAG: IS1182 family transposase [Candidatus Coatesbacteria bacterium]|nr:IS1182 family transposase [Candidatus Coatesbacteria bacterium]